MSPGRPCRYCLEGLQNQCLDMRFYDSAMRFPHVQGAFREVLVCDETQAHAIADGMSLGEAAIDVLGQKTPNHGLALIQSTVDLLGLRPEQVSIATDYTYRVSFFL